MFVSVWDMLSNDREVQIKRLVTSPSTGTEPLVLPARSGVLFGLDIRHQIAVYAQQAETKGHVYADAHESVNFRWTFGNLLLTSVGQWRAQTPRCLKFLAPSTFGHGIKSYKILQCF